MEIIETEELTRRFNSLTAVDRLSITVKTGETFGLLGPNGAGKSTTIKMLITLLPPTSGVARVAGYDIAHQAGKVRQAIGYVPQLLSVDSSLTAYENLLIFAKLYEIPRREIHQRAMDSLIFMGLEDAADKLVSHFSGGMIRRLEVAQAMMHRPRVLFLDEPTVGLDPIARMTVWEHIAKLRDDYGTAIFLTTHYMEEADALCQRVAIMNHGQVAAIGSPAELKLSLGIEEATLDQVFAHYTGNELDSGGNYRDASRTRRAASRLG
jgi:ABC-2 type transport system ATP-binding protein